MPRWGIPVFGASDVTRTRDLLITSGGFAVFYRSTMYQKVLYCNAFSNSSLRIILATRSIFLYRW